MSPILKAKEAIRAACMFSTLAFFETQCAIHAKGGEIQCAALGRPPRANEYQRKIGAVEEWCSINGVPNRTVALKPRRGGSSTIGICKIYKDMAASMRRSASIADSDATGDKLQAMLKLIAAHYTLDKQKANVVDKKARWPNGSIWDQYTAGSPHAGIGGGLEVLHLTEVAKWCKKKDSNTTDERVFSEIAKCVPNLPGTSVFMESTAWGANGLFFDMVMSAITFDDLKAGKRGYVLVFSPWFEFNDYVLDDPTVEGIKSSADYTTKEHEIVERFGLNDYQLAWRRYAIRELCVKSEDIFDQDYPSDVHSAFLKSGNMRFNADSIARMREDSKKHIWEFGNISMNQGRPQWQPTAPSDARVMRLEPPKIDRRYLISVDPMTGASQVAGADPDCHSVKVWREGWYEGLGEITKWRPHRIVASLIHSWDLWLRDRKHTGLRFDIDVLEREVWALSQMYGNCTILIEMNKDAGLTELLKKRNANLYTRPIFNKVDQKTTNAYGWLTTEVTRPMMIEALAKGIREYGHSEDGVEIFDPVVLAQCETFITNSAGKTEAMSGSKDDEIFSSSLGLLNLSSATTYRREIQRRAPLMDRYGDEYVGSREAGA